MNRHCTRSLATAVAFSLTGLGVGISPASGALEVTEVSDAQLAGMRGKFVSGGGVVYFGVEMQTRWQTADGSLYTGGVSVGIDRSTGLQPTVTVMSHAQARIAEAQDMARAYADRKISLGGLSGTRGVGQVVQVTGDGNQLVNVLTMNVTDQPVQHIGDDRGGSARAIAGTPGGGSVTTHVDPDSLGVTLNVPGQGQVTQGLSHVTGIQQRAQVYGDLNVITNTMMIAAQVQATHHAITSGTRASLRSLRGIGAFGYF